MIKICDTHNDFLTELPLSEIPSYINFCKEASVENLCASYWSSKRNEKDIQSELLERNNLLKTLNKNFLLHIEDLWWVKNEEKLKFLLNLKPFSCSLTWNDENCIAGGTNSTQNLTLWGKYCLKQLVDRKIQIDLAHLNRKSFYSVARILKDNLYCSHTGFYGMKKHKRNLTDKQIDLIVKSKGFVGLFFFDKCTKVSNSKEAFGIQDIVQNLKYFTSRWGFDNIGIGSDFYGIDNFPVNLENYERFYRLEEELQIAGFYPQQINKIFYKNFEDFLRRIQYF